MRKKLKPIVTKSIRLTPDEAEAIETVLSTVPGSEASILKAWVMDGARRTRLEQAIHAYMERLLDIREGADQAGLPYLEFMRELERRRVAVLEESQGFIEGLSALAERFGSAKMRTIARRGRKRGTFCHERRGHV